MLSVENKPTVGQGITTTVSRRLAALSPLTAEDFGILNSLKGRTAPAGTIVHAGGHSDTPCYVLSGWSARVSTISAGDTRQVMTILLPGDGFGIGASSWAGESLPVCTLTNSVLLDAAAIHTAVRAHLPVHSRLADACARASWLEQKYTLNHIVRLGRQNAYHRMAHFIRELFERLDQVGLADGGRFCLPIRQQILADVLGLSGVHFNRIARQMKRDGLIDFPRGAVHILDPVRLREMTDAAWIGL